MADETTPVTEPVVDLEAVVTADAPPEGIPLQLAAIPAVVETSPADAPVQHEQIPVVDPEPAADAPRQLDAIPEITAPPTVIYEALSLEPPPVPPPPPPPFPELPDLPKGWELKSAPGALRLEYWNAERREWLYVLPEDKGRYRDETTFDLPRFEVHWAHADGALLPNGRARAGEDLEPLIAPLSPEEERMGICRRWSHRLGRAWRYFHTANEHSLSGEEAAAYARDMERLVDISPDPYRDNRLAWWQNGNEE